MTLTINININIAPELACFLERGIMAQIGTLKQQVASNHDAIESAIVLINGIADRIKAAGVDQEQLDALVADLKNEDDNLAAAVAANTPAAPTPADNSGAPSV